jgi:dihydrofolate reductase
MIKCSVYCGASLDGFIAGPGGDIDWLHRPEFDEAAAVGLTYDRFVATVDALVMGRHTFEKLLSFDAWHYTIPVIVLSSTLKALPAHLDGKARLMSGAPEEVARTLAAGGHKHLYIDGGITVQRFLKAGLIDELTITYLPIVLGRGIPLFGNDGAETPLELIEAANHKDFVQLRYRTRLTKDLT